MATSDVTLGDLARDPAEVARGLVAWQRGEPDEAALETLAASAGVMSRSGYTLWAWQGRTAGDEPAWALPITSAQAARFAPRGPAAALARSIVAALDLGADPATLRLEDWRGYACLIAPGMAEELSSEAIEEAHPAPGRARMATLPSGIALGGPQIALGPDPEARGRGLVALGRGLSLHPVRALIALHRHGLPTTAVPDEPVDLVRSLRDLGCAAEPSPTTSERAPRLAIDDDACPRRRHARRVLRRLLQKGKIGGHHTEIGHFTRGLPDHDKRDAKEVVEALLRAGVLVEKPSVGQRHISLNRESLPEIHALIERGETLDPQLAGIWTAPAPAEATATELRAP